MASCSGRLLRARSHQGPSSDDYAEVGSLGADSCFEARAQSDVVSEIAIRQRQLLELYQYLFQDCGSGTHNLDCAARAAFEDKPMAFQKKCDARMGGQPTSSGALCRFSKRKVEKLTRHAYAYEHLAWLLKMARGNCEVTPYACVNQADLCLDAVNINFCFRECLRTGNMGHMMKAPPVVPTNPPATGLGL